MMTMVVLFPTTSVIRRSVPSIPHFNWSLTRKIPKLSSSVSQFQPSKQTFGCMAFVAQSSSTIQNVTHGNGVDNSNIFQLIHLHQEKAARLPPGDEIKTVLVHSLRGMLSTFSQKYEGYPSGSMVDFACEPDGSPILAVSSLAVHTKDLLANPKCSLLVAKDPVNRTDLVITLHGDAIPVTEEERVAIHSAYLGKHPDAFWVNFGDFQFVRIRPKVVRYVSGVATALLGSGVFNEEEYGAADIDPIYQFSRPITSHMNKDHGEDTRLIVQHSTSVPVDSAFMLDVDSLGFNVKAIYQENTYKLRIPFPRRAVDRKSNWSGGGSGCNSFFNRWISE